MNRLIDVEVAASEATKRVDADLLKRKKAQADPGLYNLVWRGAEIWSSLTGRTSSANSGAPPLRRRPRLRRLH